MSWALLCFSFHDLWCFVRFVRFVGFVHANASNIFKCRCQMMASYFCGFQWLYTNCQGGIAIGSWFWFEALARSDSKTDERQQQIKRYSEHQQIKKNTKEQNLIEPPYPPCELFWLRLPVFCRIFSVRICQNKLLKQDRSGKKGQLGQWE